MLKIQTKDSKFYSLSLSISLSIHFIPCFQLTNQCTWRHSSSVWRIPQSGSPVPEHFLTHRVVYGPACSESESSPNEGPPYRGPPLFLASGPCVVYGDTLHGLARRLRGGLLGVGRLRATHSTRSHALDRRRAQPLLRIVGIVQKVRATFIFTIKNPLQPVAELKKRVQVANN